jgi:hypothetical protein
MVKVEEGEEDGNEKNKKVWKDCNVEALIVVCQGDGAPILLKMQKKKWVKFSLDNVFQVMFAWNFRSKDKKFRIRIGSIRGPLKDLQPFDFSPLSPNVHLGVNNS